MAGNLEGRTFKTPIKGKEAELVEVTGYVNYSMGFGEEIIHDGKITGHERVRYITIANANQDQNIRFRFRGELNARYGDSISAGLIKGSEDKDGVKEAAYVAFFDQMSRHSNFYESVEYMNGFHPTLEERKRIIVD